jgi:UDP-2,3-diacylglucosamine pyrophosphatase LpxH
MLVIISDIHLGDGTTAASISPVAFDLFASRLNEAAYFASFRQDGSYRPIENIDLVLMGDILDPLHSTRWLNIQSADPDDILPWTDSTDPGYPVKLREVTRAILDENKESVDVLRQLASGEAVKVRPANWKRRPHLKTRVRLPVKVNIHYMVGNHDWYYHLPGESFNQIRRDIITAMGLSNADSPFPHRLEESPALHEIFSQHKVYGRHGDIYDNFNYNREKGRDHSTLGDALSMKVFNRYPLAVQERFGDEIPDALVDSLRRLVNVRPVLAAPLWISGQLKRHAGSAASESELKRVWDDLCDEFLQLPIVRQADKAFKFDIVDALELIVKISRRASFNNINDLVIWIREKIWRDNLSFADHALDEPAFLDGTARYIVYGHTHHHEIVSLDAEGQPPYPDSQVYLNTGTWHSYYDLAIKNPLEQKFLPYQALTYLTFYKDDEREGRNFDAWSGTYM